MAEFKDMFRNARTSKQLQQKDLAEMLGVVPAYISRLEKGFSLPSNDLILKLCTILDLDVQGVYLQVILEKTDNKSIRDIISTLIQSIQTGQLSNSDQNMAQKIAQLDASQKRVVTALVDTLCHS